jgi:hypothetical protein
MDAITLEQYSFLVRFVRALRKTVFVLIAIGVGLYIWGSFEDSGLKALGDLNFSILFKILIFSDPVRIVSNILFDSGPFLDTESLSPSAFTVIFLFLIFIHFTRIGVALLFNRPQKIVLDLNTLDLLIKHYFSSPIVITKHQWTRCENKGQYLHIYYGLENVKLIPVRKKFLWFCFNNTESKLTNSSCLDISDQLELLVKHIKNKGVDIVDIDIEKNKKTLLLKSIIFYFSCINCIIYSFDWS